ncbi:NAD(P)-binding protein [Xylona heveae TC161]|uniref:NAD(P)-binding protein n=1 Tax=Xylona heveae (strain CBS 132557 / TC161) TaxID=1328760 RepID=A0A165HE87_XYLHT|nr:NAD(P)-binding protein [Xylona heveae TC161]KZF23378.1 NAD(P)-binding protein [Xylona heveae TC161]
MPVDYQNDLLVITCASGRQASHVLPLVAGRWKRLRLVVNSESSQSRLKKAYPDAEVVRADLALYTETDKILNGAAAVFHVGPPFHPRETEMGYNMIDSATKYYKEGTLKHFVFTSVLNTQIRKMMNHDCKRYIEERLIESGIDYTFLQPTHFMDLMPLPLLLSQESPIYTCHWNPETTFSFIALRDLAEAVVRVLDEREKHFLAQYPIVSTAPLSYTEVGKILSKVIGKEVKIARTASFEESVESFLKLLFGNAPVDYITRDTTERMLLYYNEHRLAGNPNVLEWLIGRKATSYEEWAKLNVQEIQKQKQ